MQNSILNSTVNTKTPIDFKALHNRSYNESRPNSNSRENCHLKLSKKTSSDSQPSFSKAINQSSPLLN